MSSRGSSSSSASGSSPCELNDWEWSRFKEELDLAKWPNANKRVGVALVGLGRMGLIHLRNLIREPRAALLYCVDADQTRLDACAKSVFFQESGIRTLHSDDLKIALADKRVDAVVIATPTDFHERQVRLALEAGKNVMCEKPLTPLTASIMPLYQLAKENRVGLMAAFNRRYDPDFRYLREKAINRTLGPLHMVRITARDNERPPLRYIQSSSGIFHDTCIHDIDMCLWMMRQLPISVQVVGKTWKEFFKSDELANKELSDRDREILETIDDYFLVIITLKFGDGSIGVLDNSRQANYGYDQRCEIYGTKGMLKCDGRRPLNSIECKADGMTRSTLNYGFASRFSTAYINELQDILTIAEMTKNGDTSVAPADYQFIEPTRPSLVIATHTIADACVEAAKSGNLKILEWSKEFRELFDSEIRQ